MPPWERSAAPLRVDVAPLDAAAPVPPSIRHIRIGSASEIGKEMDPRVAHLGDWLTLDVDGLDGLTQEAAKDKKPLQLFLNGLPLTGVPPVYYQGSSGEEGYSPRQIRFQLIRTDEAQDTWTDLLGRPGIVQRNVEVSVGVAGCAEGCADSKITEPLPIKLVVLRQRWLTGFIGLLLVFAATLVWLARHTPLLRDRGAGSPWSLGRTQMAWWFFFVIASFVFIWMVTGSYSSLSNSVLALIGISSGTALAGATIDDSKQNQVAQRATLEAERQKMQEQKGLEPLSPEELQKLQQITAQLAQLPDKREPGGFWYDLLADENGISFHRYQIVAWTLVLTVIFVVGVWVRLAMPDFDNQLLALMGISSGTYLGFKLPEKKV